MCYPEYHLLFLFLVLEVLYRSDYMGEKPKHYCQKVVKYSGAEEPGLGRYSKYCNASEFKECVILKEHWKRVEFGAE